MQKKLRYNVADRQVEREFNYIPVRYILAFALTLLEVLAIAGIVAALCRYVPCFYIAAWLTEVACVVQIAASDDNPDYKVPWLLVVLLVPVAGFMLYFLFYSRTLKKKYVRRMQEIKAGTFERDDGGLFGQLRRERPAACSQARMLCGISESHLYANVRHTYFPLGEKMWVRLLEDLRSAEKFIYMECFIIEEGAFWNSILEILREKPPRAWKCACSTTTSAAWPRCRATTPESSKSAAFRQRPSPACAATPTASSTTAATARSP